MSIANLERYGFEVHDVEAWREHYARTTRLWHDRLFANRAAAEHEVGAVKTRLWIAYLAGVSIGFAQKQCRYFSDARLEAHAGAVRAAAVARGSLSLTAPRRAVRFRKAVSFNAPTGNLAIATLTGISTEALLGDDVTYTQLQGQIGDHTNRRNEIAGKMIALLESAAAKRMSSPRTRPQALTRLFEKAHCSNASCCPMQKNGLHRCKPLIC